MSGWRPLRGWRAVNALFFVSTVLESMAMGHQTAFTPLFLIDIGVPRDDIGVWTGLLYAAMMAVAFPLAPFWGALAERYSRRAIIVRSQYLEAVAYTAMALAPDVWWLLGARLVLGLTFGNIAVVIATQTLLTPRRHVGTAIATVQAAAPIAASFGPPLGAWLVESIGLRGLFFLDAAAALCAAVLVTVLMPEPAGRDRKSSVLARTRETSGLIWRNAAIRWNFFGWFLGQGGRSIVDAYLPLRIAQLTPDPAPAIGFILGVYGLLTAAATWLVARLVDETGGVRWFLPAMVLGAVATLGLAFAPTLWSVAALAWARSFPFAANNTLLYAQLARTLPPGQQTSVMAMTPMPRNVAAFTWPLLAAAAAPFGVGAALAVGAGSYAAAAVVGWLLIRATIRPSDSHRRPLAE